MGRLKLLIPICLFAVVECFAGASWKRIVLPSGSNGYSVRCDEGINACYEIAGEACHRGYEIQNQNTQEGYASQGGGYVGPGIAPGTAIGIANSSSKSTSETGLLIQCKEPEVTEYERMQREKAAQRQLEREQKRTTMVVLITMGAVSAIVVVAAIFSHSKN
jgi:hypothetical protein